MKLLIRNYPLLLAALVAACSVFGAFGASCIVQPAFIETPIASTSAENGRRLFVQSCAHCHGDDARGDGVDGDGPDLFALRIGNARIASVIRGGVAGEMPSFRTKYGPAEIAALTAFLRSLGEPAAPAPPMRQVMN